MPIPHRLCLYSVPTHGRMQMAVADGPTSNNSISPVAGQDKAAEVVTDRAGVRDAPASEVSLNEPRKRPIMLRFDAGLLRRVDTAAKRRGISRSAWIAFKVSEALDAEGT